MKRQRLILVLNAGSSSLKFALFSTDQTLEGIQRFYHGQFRNLDGKAHFSVADARNDTLMDAPAGIGNHEQAIDHLLRWMDEHLQEYELVAAGHRIVHGGSRFERPVRIDPDVLEQLRAFVPLAPLHMPHNLAAIEALRKTLPGLKQVACFDTAFHRGMQRLEQIYALPREWLDKGVRRYGFHGLSYEYIAAVLPHHLGEQARGRVIVAHLGHGASLCAMRDGRSIATTMGFTPLDGVPMATRPGHLDPGIITWMIRQAGLSVTEVDDLLNHHSGLSGLSGSSGDMQELLADHRPEAIEAVDYFVHHTHRAIGSLAAALGGLDALVFTAGIGENAPSIRERICDKASWLGIAFDAVANTENRVRISLPQSRVSVWCIPTDEEAVIARHTFSLISAGRQGEPP